MVALGNALKIDRDVAAGRVGGDKIAAEQPQLLKGHASTSSALRFIRNYQAHSFRGSEQPVLLQLFPTLLMVPLEGALAAPGRCNANATGRESTTIEKFVRRYVINSLTSFVWFYRRPP